jgi:glutathione S-transferase
MSELVLHSYRRCPFAIRVRMTLEEKGLLYRTVEENLAELSEELLKIHPEGQVPVLIHDGRVIAESAIITEYLEEIFPQARLMPLEPAQRAQVRVWTNWCDRKFKPDLDAYKYELPKLPESDQTVLLDRVHSQLSRLELILNGSNYLVGDTFSLADIHLFPFYRQLVRAHPKRSDFTGFPHLNGWLESVQNRPSFKRVMEKKT